MAEAPRRVNFFNGLMLTAADLAAEQEYHRRMRYLHNRLLHGYGTVSGLEVAVEEGCVHVSPGIGIDMHGREIVVVQQLSLCLEPLRHDRRWVRELAIEWRESAAEPVPGPESELCFTRWVEQPELVLAARGSSASEGLILARLTRTRRGGVDVDTSDRRPLGPA
ncbi:MAG: hypothetical protein ABR500_10615 [Dermatophilaceae bacterium]|nr:hypothetical protein [Intrasporangiaceae bacterium]